MRLSLRRGRLYLRSRPGRLGLVHGRRRRAFIRSVAHMAPDVDRQAFDLVDQDQDGLPGRAELVPSVRAQARPPAPQRLQLLIVETAAHLGGTLFPRPSDVTTQADGRTEPGCRPTVL